MLTQYTDDHVIHFSIDQAVRNEKCFPDFPKLGSETKHVCNERSTSNRYVIGPDEDETNKVWATFISLLPGFGNDAMANRLEHMNCAGKQEIGVAKEFTFQVCKNGTDNFNLTKTKEADIIMRNGLTSGKNDVQDVADIGLSNENKSGDDAQLKKEISHNLSGKNGFSYVK
ncbi:unnamed protein product [Mytilus edulis]|uniref:Uncharacterized protein n=1 Tax=Mytilus edulis TaxID=6550 RepID=A0A8S3T547_MYTED|nr:unnamed protein product [Mytilus edulis]